MEYRIISTLILAVAFLRCSSPYKDQVIAENVIVVQDKELGSKNKASDLFDDVTLIPLETTNESLIGSVSKVIISDSIIYVMDQKGQSVLLFDFTGRFLFKIHHIGKGPNEYLNIEDFTLLKNGDLLILDEYRKLIWFRKDGSPYKSYRLPFYSDAVESLNDTLFVFNGSGVEDRVMIWDILEAKMIKSYIKYDRKYSGRNLKPLIKFDNQVYFQRNFSSLIYKVSRDKLTGKWLIDYGDRTISDRKLIEGELGFYFNPPSTADMITFTETKDYVIFSFQVEELNDGMPYYVYYSKCSGLKKVNTYHLFDNDIIFNIYPQNIIGATDLGQCIEVLSAYSLFEHHGVYNVSKMNPEQQKRWYGLKEKLKGVGEFDNPIIALYTLKPF